jgi:uncharacterized delta-60 repeat protein
LNWECSNPVISQKRRKTKNSTIHFCLPADKKGVFMKANIFILLCLLFTSQIFSQTVSQQWVARYNGTGNQNDLCYDLTLDQSGNVIVTGYCTNAGTSKDMQTIEYSPAGTILWRQSYDGAVHGGDYSFAVTTDAAGNVYVTGRSDNGISGSDITTIMYNSSGVRQWVALYDGPASTFDEGECVQADNSGNIYVAGTSMGVSSGQDIVLIKYNLSGVQQWVQRYNGPGNGYDFPHSMTIDASGNIYIAGESLGAGADYVTLKFDPSGTQNWVQRYNGVGNGGDVAVSVKLDALGNVYVTGYSDGGVTSYDFVTIKYTSSGTQTWLRIYNSQDNQRDVATAMAVDAAGNVYVTGSSSTGPSLSDSIFATIKYNTDGVWQWGVTYSGPINTSNIPRSIALDNGGNVYVAGSSYLPPDMDDYATIKYNPSGVEQWVMRYNGPANNNDYSSAVAVDGSGNVYVTGRSIGVSTGYDFATIKYSSLVGITPISNGIPSGFSLGQNYPNPFNPSTKVNIDLPVSSYVTMKIYNIEGKEVLTPLNEFVAAGSYNLTIDAGKISSGVYFYKLIAGSFSDTKRMVLIK